MKNSNKMEKDHIFLQYEMIWNFSFSLTSIIKYKGYDGNDT